MRIITGTAKGRSIDAPEGRNTRPTLAKVKEGVFGIIQFRIYGRQVLDLFSGSGNLGLESISRGAERCIFNDMSRDSIRIIEGNISKLGMKEQSVVYNMEAMSLLKMLASRGEKFDVVFLDPPYNTPLLDEALKNIDELGLLNDDGIIVCEHDPKTPPELYENGTLEVKNTRKYGACGVSIVEKRVESI